MRSLHGPALALALLLAVHPAPVAAAEVTRARVEAALPELAQLVRQAMKSTGVPGVAIVVVHQDRVVYLRGFGTREAGKDAPVGPDTVFPLASVSKPFASTVLAILVGEGLIDWDDRLIDRIPDFRLFDPLATRDATLRDVLCHRSGLPVYAGDTLVDLDFDRVEVMRRLRFLRPTGPFRASYQYNNATFTLAGHAAERATKTSWEALSEEKLYRPLGMKSTSSRYADYLAARDRSKEHALVGGKWSANDGFSDDACSPAGGVSSTARDLARWMRLHLGGGKFEGKQLVEAKALRETHRPHIASGFDPKTDRPGFYGLGWNVFYDERGRLFWSHSGAFNAGVRTEVALLPGEQLGIGILTNGANTGLPEGLRHSFFDLVLKGKVEKDHVKEYNALFARFVEELQTKAVGEKADYRKPRADAVPPLPLDAYAGTYHNDYHGPVEVARKGKGLVIRLGAKKTERPLWHYDRDVFAYEPWGDSPFGPTAVVFRIDADRRASSVLVRVLNGEGLGVFTRAAGKE